MNKATARKIAKCIAARDLRQYLDVGQPYEDHGCEGSCKQCDTLRDEFIALAARLEAQGKGVTRDVLDSLVGGGEQA